jgi:thiol:disulfide interchange protein DsbD
MEALIAGLEAHLGSSFVLSVSICFAAGFLASLSPCVYPLIPVVATYVGSRSVGESTRLKAFSLSVAYVLGMALIYTVLGMIAALTGAFFGQVATSPWANLVVGNVIILLGLNILEVIPLPSATTSGSGGEHRKGLFGAFLIGAISGLVASPCTIPVLGIVLTFVATTQSVLQGGAMLFTFSLGMGMLLIVVGTFSGLLTSIPRPGNWMFAVRKVLGLAMIGVGEYFILQAGQLMM